MEEMERVARALCIQTGQDPEWKVLNWTGATDKFPVAVCRIPAGFAACPDARMNGELFPLWMFYLEAAREAIHLIDTARSNGKTEAV